MRDKNIDEFAQGLRESLDSQNPSRYGDPDCRECHGTGFLFDPFGGGESEGGYRICDCLKEKCLCGGRSPYLIYNEEKNIMEACPDRPVRILIDRIYSILRRSGIPERYRGKFLSSINYLSKEGALSDLRYAADFSTETIRNYGKGEICGLFYYGPTGTGKTLFAIAVLNEFVRLYQIPVRYAKITRDILGRLRSSFNPSSDTYGEGRRIEQELANVEVLVIDDLGTHTESDWVNSVLYDLIDSRYENNKLTIITSNEPMEAWESISNKRIYSRLKEMCREIKIDAPDYRLSHTPSPVIHLSYIKDERR